LPVPSGSQPLSTIPEAAQQAAATIRTVFARLEPDVAVQGWRQIEVEFHSRCPKLVVREREAVTAPYHVLLSMYLSAFIPAMWSIPLLGYGFQQFEFPTIHGWLNARHEKAFHQAPEPWAAIHGCDNLDPRLLPLINGGQ
jgi:hypothetical protein